MEHLLQLTKYFFKKNLKSIISFSIILLISALMFVSGLTITLNIGRDYDKKFEELNTANSVFIISAMQFDETLEEEIRDLDGVDDVDIVSGILLNIPIEMSDSTQNQNQIFYNVNDVKKLNKYSVYKSTDKDVERPIYISYYLYANSKIELEDKFEVKVEGKVYTFDVKGVAEEMQYGNYSSSLCAQYLDEESYNYLKDGNERFEVKSISVKSKDSVRAYNDVSKYLANKNISTVNKGYDEAKKQSRLSVSKILSLILLVFSIIILLISLLVTKFKIKQSIEEDIVNMGVLKSLGYKSKDVMCGIIAPYLLSATVVTVVGIVASIPITGVLGKIISSQAGFVWTPKLNILAALIALVVNIGLIILFAYTSAVKIKSLNPIEAIRGRQKESIAKNRFEVEKTKGNINVVLALKNFVNNLSSNILLGIVLVFITILTSFVISLFYNVNVNPTNFINTLVEEYPTVMVRQKQDIKEEVKGLAGVRNVIYYDENGEITLVDTSYKAFVAESYENLANDLVYEGKNPSDGGEVAVGSAIKEKYGYKIGDVVTLSKNGIDSDYKIVGFIQSVNNSGEVLEITLDGYKKLDEEYTPKCIYVYLNDESEKSAKEFIEMLDENYSDEIELSINYVESMNSASVMFLNIVKLVTIAIIVVTILIIFLILNILISGVISDKKQELGVLKSIGYTTNNLKLQIVGGFMPASLLSILFGIIINKLAMKGIFGIIFGMIGVYKVSFEYPLFIFIIMGLFVLLGTVITGVLLCGKIKKISVYSLIKE